MQRYLCNRPLKKWSSGQGGTRCPLSTYPSPSAAEAAAGVRAGLFQTVFEQGHSQAPARLQLASSQLGPSQVSVSILTTGTQPQFPHK